MGCVCYSHLSVGGKAAKFGQGGVKWPAAGKCQVRLSTELQNGTITVHLVATQVTAAPASMSGGSGATYDTGSVTATVGSTNFTVNYGQTSTAATVASALASAITAGQLGLTATAGAGGALMVTANTAGAADNGIPVTVNSSTSEPGLFSSPSFSGTSGSLGGGTDSTLNPGTIYSYSIPSPPTANTGYAGNGNLQSYTDSVNGQWTAIGYNTLNQLTTATVAGTPSTTYTWGYDAFGNRKSQEPNGGTVNYPPGNNRIGSYSYNADGSISDDNNPYGYQYGYDGEGRVCVVYNKTMATWTGYAYDGLGNRVAKGTALNSLNCDNNFTPSSTYVVGQNGELLDSLDASGAVYSNVFANGHLLATYQFPISQSQAAEWTYALNDWLGTKRFVADSNGEMLETCTGLPFGDGLNCQGPGADPSPLHFTGKERDAESGNDYFVARYYESNMGRFLTPDWSAKLAAVPYAKLGNPQTLNLYSYVGNNPLSAVDPDGHQNTPGGTQCGQTVSIACSDPGDEAAGELKASESQYVAQLQQAQQQIHTETTVTVTAKSHWWSRLGTSLAIGFARFGRLGGPAHRAAIGRISRILEEDGYSVTQEKYIPTENGAKGYRFADVYGKNNSTGEVRMYQVGRTNANGTPVSREVQAMDDIQGATGIRPQFIDYNNPVVTGEMPVMPMGDMPEPEIPEIPIDIP